MTAVAMDSSVGPLPADGTVHFGLIELDLLATHAGVPVPFPLRVPSFGRIAGEREVLLAAAGQTLRMRGLADETGPIGAAAELVTALREHRGTVDLVLDGTTLVVAMVYRSFALICHQVGDDPAGLVGVRRIKETALADALQALVPELEPARTMPIMLPARAMTAALRLIDDVENDRERVRVLRTLVGDCGGDPDMLHQLAGLLPAVTGRGQLGATRRSGEARPTHPPSPTTTNARAGTELSWLDGPRGRVRVDGAGGWVSVNPLRPAGLRFALEDLVTIARYPR